SIFDKILVADPLPQDPVFICMAYEELGRVYLRTGNRAKFQEARDKTAEWGSISKSLVEMGRVYILDAEDCWLQGQRGKAIRNIRKAIVVFRNNGAVSPLHFCEQMLTSWLKEGVRRHEEHKEIGGHHVLGSRASRSAGQSGLGGSDRSSRSSNPTAR
ncbi:MAG: hypothetical protein ACYC6I_06465, partial [Bacillota bacterium]